ncbi:MAG: hypothetical protein ACE145_07820 [Terriglobia bacterium]
MVKKVAPAYIRRSSRVNVRIPVKISGTLADNKPFAEDTFVLTVSKYGAKIKLAQPLKVGTQIRLQPANRRNSAIFKVVWTGREGSPRQGEMGIEYVEVSNLLGITFPE